MLPRMAPRERLMLLDSASLYFRAFFGVPDSVKAPDGTPVNAVRGFLDFIATLVTGQQPTHLVACWDDDWRPQFRVDAIPSYKAHRVASPRPGARRTSRRRPTRWTSRCRSSSTSSPRSASPGSAPGFEADDVIGTLSERGAAAGMAVDVVTGDRDLFQLVDDARQVRVLYTAKGGVRNLDVVDEARLFEKYGIRGGRAYAGMAALRGDPSDGLPGVPGIGEKTAAALLGRAGDYDGLMRALADDDQDVLGNSRSKLQAASDYLAVAARVVDVVRDIPIAELDCAFPASPPIRRPCSTSRITGGCPAASNGCCTHRLDRGVSGMARDWDVRGDELAAEAIASGEPTAWFDRLYTEGARARSPCPGTATTRTRCCASGRQARGLDGSGRRAVVVGCGLGADAEYLSRLGFATTAFDVAPTAVHGRDRGTPQAPSATGWPTCWLCRRVASIVRPGGGDVHRAGAAGPAPGGGDHLGQRPGGARRDAARDRVRLTPGRRPEGRPALRAAPEMMQQFAIDGVACRPSRRSRTRWRVEYRLPPVTVP